MSQPVPYEFQNRRELIERLLHGKTEYEKWFAERKESLEEIVRHSVAGNTFRAFQRLPQKPSIVFRTWASEECMRPSFIGELESVRSQTDYDGWLSLFSDKLNDTWQKHMDQSMPFGPRRKLPNLLMKEVVLWTGLSNGQRTNLIQWLHVPLDSYTLVGIRNCIENPKIPKRATMGFVASETVYDQIQLAIRKIAAEAKVPAIYFDNLAWNSKH
jgi:hypothetical protein